VAFDPASAVDSIETAVRAAGTPERARQEKRYLKSELEFLGASVWEIRRVVQAFLRDTAPLTHDQLVALVEALWERPVHERRMAAVALLELQPLLLGPADLPLIERLLRESLTWALVDGLAGDVVGGILAASPAEVTPVLDRWAADPDFWIRRSSLLAELRRLRAGADSAPFLGRADAMLDEREFFIRKAIGWVLREVGKRRPAEVMAWLAPRTHRASGVTMREAVRYLPAEDAARLMAAYREKRPAV
jgi:3-methyladenine DNA glycosylase AlkD